MQFDDIIQTHFEKWSYLPIKRRVVHVHIPKTGGSYLNDILKNAGVTVYDHACIYLQERQTEHNPIWVYTDDIESTIDFRITRVGTPGVWKEACKVSIVRNPFDWLVSYYAHDGMHKGWDDIRNIHNIHTFDEFVKRFCEPGFKWWHIQLKLSPFYQIYDFPDDHMIQKIGVDYVLRQEYLGEGISLIGKGLRLIPKEWTAPVTKINETPNRGDYRSYYTDELRELATTHFAQELELFDYDFDGPLSQKSILSARNLGSFDRDKAFVRETW